MKTIPYKITSRFDFHDSFVLSAVKKSRDYLIYIGNADDGRSPYVKVIFKNVSKITGDQDWQICTERDPEEGVIFSDCRYIYENIEHTDKGYKITLTLWTSVSDRCITLDCEDIEFDNSFDIEEIWNNK